MYKILRQYLVDPDPITTHFDKKSHNFLGNYFVMNLLKNSNLD